MQFSTYRRYALNWRAFCNVMQFAFPVDALFGNEN